MKTFFSAVLIALFISACGQPDALETFRQNQRKPHAVSVNTWQGSDTLGKNKQTVMNACKRRGASDAQAALVIAMGMAETTDFSAAQRDASKDGTPSANYSAFNLNLDCLQQLGWQKGAGPDLNNDANLDDAVGWVLKGFEVMNEIKFQDFHRGGRVGFEDGVSYGCVEYRDTIKAVQVYLMQNPATMTDSTRVGAFIPHV